MKNLYASMLRRTMMLLCLWPTLAFAQMDEAYSDNNDGLNVPFEITAVRNGQFPSDTHWYSIRVSSGRYWYTDTSGRLCCRAVSAGSTLSDKYLWCFTGDNVAGYRLMNKYWGTEYVVSVPNSDNAAPASMKALADAPAPRTFKVSTNGDGYNFYFPGVQQACLNDFEVKGKLALWNSGASPGDGGSRMYVKLEVGEASMPSAEGLPFRPTTVGADGQLASSTHWYKMTIRGSKTIYADKSSLYCDSYLESLKGNQLWAFVGDMENGFEVYNYQTGMPYKAYCVENSNEAYVVMEDKDQVQGTSRWQLRANTRGGYNLYYPGSSESCWNDFADRGVIALWKDHNSPDDGGSTIVFAEANLNMIDQTVYVDNITLDSYDVSLFEGESVEMVAHVTPENAHNKEVEWYSNDETICTVDMTTGVVTGVAAGSTYIVCVSTDGSYKYALCKVTVKENKSILPVSGLVVYVYKKDGTVDAFPEAYLSSYEQKNGGISIVANDGTSYQYAASELKEATYQAPDDFAHITSFKFNNKYNPDLPKDCLGEIVEDSIIKLTVACIGKRLAPSFQISDSEQAKVYVGNVLQESKVTRTRFEGDVCYTVSRDGFQMLRSNARGDLMMLPFGRDYVVKADFLTDHSTNDYNVPVIYINTADGKSITSKTVYKDATISIQGGGVFPDLEETAILIKGRGNSSWGEAKKPYHFKFDKKTSVLDLTKGKHWNLIANAQRMSMMTNAIGMKVARMVGTQAANDEVPVELYLNGKYLGSYQLTEKVGFGNNSLDISDTLVNATLLELDTYYDEVNKFRTSTTYYNLPVNIKEPESFTDGSVAFKLYDVKDRVMEMLMALKKGENFEAHADVQSLATFLMTNELILNRELMHPKSTFMFNRDILNPDSLFYFGPVWDLDWAYGYESSATYYVSDAEMDYWNGSKSMESWTFMKALRYNSGEKFEREYFRVWTRFMQGQLGELLEYCDDYLDFARPSFTHNSEVWAWYYEDYDSNVEQAKAWLQQRANYVYDYLCNTLGLKEKYSDVYENPDGLQDIVNTRPVLRLEDHNVYTLDGKRVTNTGKLPRGIYIINGRKTVIR